MIQNLFLIFLSLVLIHPMAMAAKSYQKGWTAGASLLYPINRQFHFSGKRTSTGEKISAQFEFEAIPAIEVFVKRTKERGWGFSLGYEYIPPSKLRGGTLTIGSTSSNPSNTTFLDKYSLSILHFGTEYRYDRIYFPIEVLAILLPDYSLKQGHYGYCSSGSYGYSGGVGYHWQRYMFSELVYRSIGMGYCEHLGYGANSAKDEYWTGKSNELVFSFGFHL